MKDVSGGFLPHVGLCSVCAHVKKVENRRGSAFFLCRRAGEDPSFPRYPRLPVLACRGFEPQGVPDASPNSDEGDEHE